jgi:hypothetical protein
MPLTGVAAHLRRHGASAALFIANFGVARVVVYLIPLAIAAIAPAAVYGAIEFSQSVSLLGAALLIGAPLAGVSQRYLVNKEPLAVDVVAASVILAAIMALVAGGIAWLASAPPLVTMSLLALALAAVHNAFAVVFRTLTWRNVTVWSDGFAFIVTFGIVLIMLGLTGSVDAAAIALGYAVFAGVALLGAILAFVRARRPAVRDRARRMIHFGAPVLVSSAFAVWQAGAGRILAGLFLPSALPAYAIAFRIVGLALGLHQLAATALFSRLYSGRTRATDGLLSLLLAAVAATLLVIAAASRLLVRPQTFEALDGAGYDLFVTALPIVAVQIFFWIGNAMLEMRITRFGLAKKTILASIIINGSALAGLFTAQHVVPITLPAICWTVAAQSAAFFFFSAWLLYRRGVPHRKLATAGAVGGLVLAIIALA